MNYESEIAWAGRTIRNLERDNQELRAKMRSVREALSDPRVSRIKVLRIVSEKTKPTAPEMGVQKSLFGDPPYMISPQKSGLEK